MQHYNGYPPPLPKRCENQPHSAHLTKVNVFLPVLIVSALLKVPVSKTPLKSF